MKAQYLFPDRYKRIGWIVLIPTFILGILFMIFNFEPDFLNVTVFAVLSEEFFGSFQWAGLLQNNILDEILGILMILSLLVVAFSKEPDEDELILKIRLESLVWATYFSYGVLLLAFILVYDVSFFTVMICNMFTVLIFFIIRFNWKLWKLRKSVGHEE